MTNDAAIGDQVHIQVGGSVYFEPDDPCSSLLLLAGGVGINVIFLFFLVFFWILKILQWI